MKRLRPRRIRSAWTLLLWLRVRAQPHTVGNRDVGGSPSLNALSGLHGHLNRIDAVKSRSNRATVP